LHDPRFIFVDHPVRLGATRAINLMFQPVSEPYMSLLEDDNWWEASFLETLLTVMEKHPSVQVAWANMRCWLEQADGSWTDTGKTIWDRSADAPLELFEWGQPQQMWGALHSNGAMLVRSQLASRYSVPEGTPFDAMEATRERSYPHPILLVPQVCANYALSTKTSARSDNPIVWGRVQTLLVASFLRHVPQTSEQLKQIWNKARSKPARSTATLFLVALTCSDCTPILSYATSEDWLFFIRFCLRHPIRTWQISRAIAVYPDVWNYLDQHTARQCHTALSY
jgi:hypothetical protein